MKYLYKLSVILLCFILLCGCSKKSDTIDTSNCVLTKVRLGMSASNVLSVQNDVKLYYESDKLLWAIDEDTSLKKEVTPLIPQDDMYYYVGESIISYEFTDSMDRDDAQLKSYSEELICLIDRETAETYYKDRMQRLISKYKGVGTVYESGTLLGVEGIDKELSYTQRITGPSYTLDFTMDMAYETVNDVADYYVTGFTIKTKAKDVKDSVNFTLVEAED